jgi:hypothetical protein
MADNEPYVIWSNEHKCWWAADERGYCSTLAGAGRYSRDHALKICARARGGRQFNDNPSEVPMLLADAEAFWGEDRDDWRAERERWRRIREGCEDE